MSLDAVKTYRYLRVALVGAVAMLFTALAVQAAAGEEPLGSISAMYYTPLQIIFVGVLFATGFMLVAVRGRAGWENTLLDLAGMLLPVVAVIPTTQVPGAAVLPGGGRASFDAYLPYAERGLTVLLVLGPLLLGFAWWGVSRSEPEGRAVSRLGAALATLAWVAAAIAAWDPFDRDWHAALFEHGHNVAAITAFALMTVVAIINARRSAGPELGSATAEARAAVWFRRVYAMVAGWMALVLAVAAGVATRSAIADAAVPLRLVFWVEVLILVPFAVFWAAQTWEFWNRGVAPEA